MDAAAVAGRRIVCNRYRTGQLQSVAAVGIIKINTGSVEPPIALYSHTAGKGHQYRSAAAAAVAGSIDPPAAAGRRVVGYTRLAADYKRASHTLDIRPVVDAGAIGSRIVLDNRLPVQNSAVPPVAQRHHQSAAAGTRLASGY